MVQRKNNNHAKVARPKAKNGKTKSKRPARSGGDALVQVPASMSRTTVAKTPKMSASFARGDGMIVVRHREYLKDVIGSIAFTATSSSINPGQESMFPWLCKLANNYESYKFRSLSFEYETCTATSVAGTVMVAVDYDAADSKPATKQVMLGYHNAVRSAAWNRATLSCDKADLQKNGQKFTRLNPLTANLDIKTYDVGNLIVATAGFAGDGLAGELYVSYEVELHTPQIIADHPQDSSAKISSTTGVNPTTILGDNPTILVSTEAPLPIRTQNNNTVLFDKVGEYLLDINAAGTAFLGTCNTVGSTATVVAFDHIINAAATAIVSKLRVKVTEPGQGITLTWLAAATTLTATILRISPYVYTFA